MNPLLEKVLLAGGGALVSLAAAYWFVGRELAFIRGAMTNLVTIAKDFHDEKIKRVLLEQRVDKTQVDVNQAHLKLRELAKRR